jgi:hypothetical protein
MTDFKVGDVVATVFMPWAKCYVVKVKKDKIKLAMWRDYGFVSRFFPIWHVTLPTFMVVEYEEEPRVTIEPYNGPERCDSCFGPKPPVSDPEEPKDRPL